MLGARYYKQLFSDVGVKLRVIRLRRGLSLLRFSIIIGKDVKHIWLWEHKKIIPTPRIIIQVLETLDEDIDKLL